MNQSKEPLAIFHTTLMLFSQMHLSKLLYFILFYSLFFLKYETKVMYLYIEVGLQRKLDKAKQIIRNFVQIDLLRLEIDALTFKVVARSLRNKSFHSFSHSLSVR